jgi:hypothetical protein
MKYPEEDYAQDLHRALARRFAHTVPPTVVAVAGAGVHWQCTAQRGQHLCAIACFDRGGDPEYLTSFGREGATLARGRTGSQPDTLAATEAWLGGQPLVGLYDRFPFVDGNKRALEGLRDDLDHPGRIGPP